MLFYNMLKIRMTGTAHTEENADCQDAIANRADGNFACMVGADGAGQASFGKEGAELVCSTSLDVMARFNTDFVGLQTNDIKVLMNNHLSGKLASKAEELQCHVSDLASTLMFFATDGERYVAGNLGDGMLGYVGPGNKGAVLLGPERGEYVNQSWFVTSHDGFEHLRITRGTFCPDAVYFVLTDGSVDCLYNQRSGTFAPMLDTFCDWMRRFKYNQIHTFVKTAMHKYFPKNTTDDCAMGLLTTKNRQ